MQIRPAIPEDVPLLFSLLQRKVNFDREIGAFSGTLQVTEEKLQQTLFGPLPFAYVLFAQSAEQAVGFAIYSFHYSSYAGQPSLWLDDLYVESAMRGQGVGTALMEHLVHIARDLNCTHLGWTADARNLRGLNFYAHLGAKIIDRRGTRCFLQWKP